MAIPEEDVAKVREATDISALIGGYTALKRVGRRFVGLCPFHSEKSPSFSVNVEEGLFYCFGCQASGDAISFVRQIEHCDFVEAVEQLAGRAGITIRNDQEASSDASRGHRQALYEAMDAAADFYHHYLLENKEAGSARRYLRSRGYDGDVVREFRIGFAPSGYDRLARSLKLPALILKEAGLAYENSRQKMQDVMRERVIFPICDPMGKVIALGGRVLPDELRSNTQNPGPKYRNSPESPIYSKSSTFYGLNWSKAEVARAHEVIVCEGYTDVIGFSTVGIKRAVATCGTSLTESHFKLLSRFAKRVVLCFDQDSAGQNAAARLYEFERRHEVELLVAAMPVGADPGQLAREDPESLRLAIESARPFLGFRVDRALGAHDLANPEGRARAATAAIGAIAEHPNDLVRDQYLLEVADRTHHDPTRLREMLESERISLTTQRVPAPQAAHSHEGGYPDDSRDDSLGREIPNSDEGSERQGAKTRGRADQRTSRAGRDGLMLAIHRPEEVTDWIDEVLFLDAIQRRAFQALCNSEELHQAIDQAEPEAAELLRRLVVSDGAAEIDANGTLIELIRSAAIPALRDLEVEARLKVDDAEAFALASSKSRWLKAELEALRDPPELSDLAIDAFESAMRILAWLREAYPVEQPS